MSVNWKKSILIALDIVIAAYLVLAITAFNKPDAEASHCTEVKTDIETSIMEGFLTADEIKKQLSQQNLYPLAQPMKDVSPRKIEEALAKSPFIENVECYKTQGGHVCIQVRQRTPIIRVMSSGGDSYYVDTNGSIMPESRYVTDQIIATGSISRKYAQTILTRAANQILSDKFWKNQVEQVHVLGDGSMELVPRVGEHIIYLGPPVNIDKKLERMRKFYLYGLNKAGWNKYYYISVEFDNQIICKKHNRIH